MDQEVVELEQLAALARRAGEACEAQRVALGRYALVWWSGEAAERYWQRVEARRAALADCADQLGLLAGRAEALAGLVRVQADALRALMVAVA